MKTYYSKIKNFDVGNGDGLGVSIFLSGCSLQCKGCFNQELWDYNYGEEFTLTTLEYVIELLKNEHITHLSVLGGEPLDPKNIGTTSLLVYWANILEKKVWLWTGYEIEELNTRLNLIYENIPDNESEYETLQRYSDDEEFELRHILDNIDYLTYGRFDISKRDLTRKYSGSTNQVTINTKTKEVIE